MEPTNDPTSNAPTTSEPTTSEVNEPAAVPTVEPTPVCSQNPTTAAPCADCNNAWECVNSGCEWDDSVQNDVWCKLPTTTFAPTAEPTMEPTTDPTSEPTVDLVSV